jgi:hypothetical protein
MQLFFWDVGQQLGEEEEGEMPAYRSSTLFVSFHAVIFLGRGAAAGPRQPGKLPPAAPQRSLPLPASRQIRRHQPGHDSERRHLLSGHGTQGRLAIRLHRTSLK